jgi:hypothetical protein
MPAYLSSGGHPQDFEPVVTGKRRIRPFRAQEGSAIVFDEDRFGDKAEFVHQIANRFRFNLLSLAVQKKIHDVLLCGVEDGGVPILPDWFETKFPQASGDHMGRTLVRDGELSFGVLANCGDWAATDCLMQILFPLASVAARFRMAACAHHGNAERSDSISQGRRLTGTQDNSDLRKGNAQRAKKLDEFAIGQGMCRMEVAGGWAETRKADGDLGLPARTQEMFEMSGESHRFFPPMPQTVKGADADAAEARLVGALRAIQPPVIVLLWSRKVNLGVGGAMVGLLVNDEPFRAGMNEWQIVRDFHWGDFKADARNRRCEPLNASLQVVAGNEFGMLAGHEKDIAKALADKVCGFARDFLNFQRDAQDGIFTGEAAIGARIDAFVGEIKRGEEAHGAPKVAPRDRGGFSGQQLEMQVRARSEQRFKLPQKRRFIAKQTSDFRRESHES